MRTQKEEETASESKKTCAKQMSKMELEQVVGVQLSFFRCNAPHIIPLLNSLIVYCRVSSNFHFSLSIILCLVQNC